MSGDTVEQDRDGVWRVRTEAGVLLGTENDGIPLAFQDAAEALDMVERRKTLHGYLRQRAEGRR